MKLEKIKELQDLATQLTGIKPVYDKEYQRLNYEYETHKINGNHVAQKRSKIFKSSKRHL